MCLCLTPGIIRNKIPKPTATAELREKKSIQSFINELMIYYMIYI